MHVQLKTPLDSIAIISDKKNKVAEIIDVDCIYLEAIQIFRDKKLAQITMRIGGVDSSGKQWPSHEHDDKIARMNISDPLFTELFLDTSGNLNINLDSSIFQRIYEEGVKGGDQLVWGFEKNTEANLVDGNNKIIKKVLDKK